MSEVITEQREKFSYSKLDTYKQCPFKYWLKYVEKKSFFSNTVATEIGTLVHETEEAIANCLQNKELVDYQKLKNDFLVRLYQIESKYPTQFSTPDKAGRTYLQKAFDYLNNGIYNLEAFLKSNPSYEIIGIEQPFAFDYNDNVSFNGFIDRVFADTAKKSLIIQDIKTWAMKAEPDKLKTPLQFVIYTLAAEKLWGSEYGAGSTCQYYLPFCHETQDAGSTNFVPRGLTAIDRIFTNIKNNEFAPNPTPLCYYCEYCVNNPTAPQEASVLCPYHSLWQPGHRSFEKANSWEGQDRHTIIQQLHEAQIRAFFKKSQ